MMRFEEDKLDYAGAFITPPNPCFGLVSRWMKRFGWGVPDYWESPMPEKKMKDLLSQDSPRSLKC